MREGREGERSGGEVGHLSTTTGKWFATTQAHFMKTPEVHLVKGLKKNTW